MNKGYRKLRESRDFSSAIKAKLVVASKGLGETDFYKLA
jgi:hypothetical protein